MLRLTILLFLCLSVQGKELDCNSVSNYKNCWNSSTHQTDYCWLCLIKNQRISTPDQEIFITPKLDNGTIDAILVRFDGDVSKLPKILHKINNKAVSQVQIVGAEIEVLNSEFFGTSGSSLTYFETSGNERLSVKSGAFENCKNLEFLALFSNGISSILADSFRGLGKLIRLDLSKNRLVMIKGWLKDLNTLEFLDLNGNQLEVIADDAFDSLTKLKLLSLGGNKIEILTKKMFQNNKELESVNLGKNRIREIEVGSFANLGKLTLILGENKCIHRNFVDKSVEEVAEGIKSCN